MAGKKRESPSEQELKGWAKDLIGQESTMTLATARGDVAWSAPVYYVCLKSCFYFFSDPSSRHIQESLASAQASCSIYANVSTWQEIRGLQMSGRIETVPVGREAMEVIGTYLKKFPFTKDFFDAGQPVDLNAFVKRFRVKLYRFRPTLVYYLDNGIRFGFREQVDL